MPLGDKTLTKQPEELQNPQHVNLNQNLNQNLTQVQPPAEETEEARAQRLQAEFRERRERRESRIRAIRESCRITMPEVAYTRKGVIVQGEAFARRSNESIGAGKRKMRQGWKRSALYQKGENARLTENSGGAWEELLAENKRKLMERRPPEERAAAAAQAQKIEVFLTGEQEKDEELLRLAGDEEAMVRICKDRFMEMRLIFDLRTDRSFAEASADLEGVAQKTREMKRLLEQFPQVWEGLTEDEKTDLGAKLEMAQDLVNYYEIRKKVITNARYRSHYNSEISYRYHESDTLEAKNLTVLLCQAEKLRSSQSFLRPADFVEGYQEYRETTEDRAEAEETRRARAKLQLGAVEYGKNTVSIEDSRHADYFRQFMQREDDPVARRLLNVRGRNYRVTGAEEGMSEPFVRHLSNLPRWKAVQYASPEYVRSMIENLTREPQNAQDRAEIASCQEANLKGMGQFKDLLKKQMNYLKRKYGNGLTVISVDELEQHGREFANDFTNMQGLGAFIDYLKKFEGMFDPQDESDLEMERLYTYYDKCTTGEGAERNAFLRGSTGSATYSDYRRRMVALMVADKSRAESVIQLSDTMHLDIRWGVAFDETDVKGAELPVALSQQDMRERIREQTEEAGIGGGPDWQQMFQETEHKSREEAARHFVEKETKERLEGKSIRELFRAAAETMGGQSEDILDQEVEIYEAYEIRREEFRRGWEELHPGETVPELSLTGTERSMRATLEMYRLYAHYETALDIRRQALWEAEKLGDQADPVLRKMYEHLAEDLRQAAEYYSKERGKVRI